MALPTKAEYLRNLQPLDECECAVCRELMSHAARPTQTLCFHTFCYQCLHSWLQDHSNSCPACRKELFHGAQEDGDTTDGLSIGPHNQDYGPIILSSEVLYTELSEHNTYLRTENDIDASENPLSRLQYIPDVPSFVSHLVGRNVRCTFSFRPSIECYGFDFISANHVAADDALERVPVHPLSIFSDQLRTFFNAVENEEWTTSVLRMAKYHHKDERVEFAVRLHGKGLARLADAFQPDGGRSHVLPDPNAPIPAFMVHIDGAVLHRLLIEECSSMFRLNMTFRGSNASQSILFLIPEMPNCVHKLPLFDARYAFEWMPTTRSWSLYGVSLPDVRLRKGAPRADQRFTNQLLAFSNAAEHAQLTTNVASRARESGEAVDDSYPGWYLDEHSNHS